MGTLEPGLPQMLLLLEIIRKCMWTIFKWQQLLLSGNNFLKFSLLSKFLGLEIISETLFYRIQKLYCCPSIKSMWNEVKDVIHEHFSFSKVSLSGDGWIMTLQGTLHDLCLHTHGRASEVGSGLGSGSGDGWKICQHANRCKESQFYSLPFGKAKASMY